jgi:transcriptional regulator with XRE-family HTH domain
MNMIKTGKFLQELRKEKELTQEQLAEQLGVARRTVSRWETGNNMPDLDILVELSDLYSVDLREILSGERKSETMDQELKETVLQVADYSSEEKNKGYRCILVR